MPGPVNKPQLNSAYSVIERRSSPRINAVFGVRFTDNTRGATLNINETGACINSSGPLAPQKTSIAIILPRKSAPLEIYPIWSKEDAGANGFLHGVKFINPTEEILSIIRRSLVYKQLRSILKNFKIRDNETKKEIVKYAKSFEQYIFGLSALTRKLRENSISRDEALNELTNSTDMIMKRGDLLETSITSRILIKKIKEQFRTLVGCWAYKSYIVKRSLDKPRGYPGDHRILEAIYDDQTLSEGIGWCFDRYFQNNEYARAVRNRKNKMRDILSEFIWSRKHENIKILNIACGSNREIRELLSSRKGTFFKKSIQFNLLDQDEEALEYSRQNLPQLPNIKYNYIKGDVFKITRNPQKMKVDPCDLIYTIGLADYLPDRVLGTLVNFLVSLLKRNGKLVVAHKDITVYKPLPPNWFCDWNFYPRDRIGVVKLIKKYTTPFNISFDTDYERSGHILFITLTRKD